MEQNRHTEGSVCQNHHCHLRWQCYHRLLLPFMFTCGTVGLKNSSKGKLCNIALYSIGPCFHHQSHPQLGVVFALALSLHTSGVITPLISSSILGTYRPGEFIFQYLIFLPFHTVHGVLEARILKWFAIPFSSGPHSVRPLHHDSPVLGGPTGHGSVSLS